MIDIWNCFSIFKTGSDHRQVSLSMTVCYYHVTYAFRIESTLYSCLNVKKPLARNRRSRNGVSD